MDISLRRLAGSVSSLELNYWGPVIGDFLNRGTEASRRMVFPPTFDEASPHLLAKVYPRESLPENASETFVARQVNDQLLATLVVEDESGFGSLTRSAAESWATPEDTLWQLALANVHASIPLSEERVQIEPGGVVRFLHSPNRLAVSHVLELGNHLEKPSPNGVVLGIPHENLLVVYEVAEGTASRGSAYVASLAADYFVKSPNTGISPLAFWWLDGAWAPISAIVADHFENAPPPGFLAMLGRLEPDTAPTDD